METPVPALQRAYKAKGVVWLTINSSGAGRPGYMSAKQTNDTRARNAASAA